MEAYSKKDCFISEIFKSGFVQKYAKKRCLSKDNFIFEDAVSDILVKICEIPDSRIELFEDYNEFRRYVSGLICRYMTDTGELRHIRNLYRLEVYRNADSLFDKNFFEKNNDQED